MKQIFKSSVKSSVRFDFVRKQMVIMSTLITLVGISLVYWLEFLFTTKKR